MNPKFLACLLPPTLSAESYKKRKRPTHLADLMPHLVVGHDTQTGQALVVPRQLQLPGEVLVEEVVLEAIESEQLSAVGHGSA